MLGIGKHAINAVDEVVYTQLLAHFNDLSMPPTDERDGSYTIVDAGQSTTIVDPKFGYRCLDNNGGSGYFTPGPGRSFATEETQDWCLECWVKVEADPADAATLFCALTDDAGSLYTPTGTVGVSLGSYNYLPTAFKGDVNFFAPVALEAAIPFWQHMAVYRVGDDLCISVDGMVAINPGSGVGFYLQNCTRLYVGAGAPMLYPNYQGNIDCLRYSVGTSRYTSENFVPPTVPFVLD